MPNPYIVGTAVIGNQFYGREALIQEVLTSEKNCFCLMGNRRIGKTSFLRQLEFLVKEEYPNFIGVFWDLQGCKVDMDLTEQLKNGLLDSEAQLEVAGINYDKLEECENLFALLRQLKRGMVSAHKTLLLLADEAESLIAVGENDPGLLGRLRSVMQDATFVRTVLCGSRRLSEVSQIGLVGSAFLDGFEPILFMSSLTEADADALIAQSHTGSGIQVSAEIATEMKEKTNRHPYLLQSICLYLYDHEMDSPLLKRGVRGDLSKAYDFVMQQGMAERAFADDYRYLSPIEKELLTQIYQTSPQDSLHQSPPLLGGVGVGWRGELQAQHCRRFSNRSTWIPIPSEGFCLPWKPPVTSSRRVTTFVSRTTFSRAGLRATKRDSLRLPPLSPMQQCNPSRNNNPDRKRLKGNGCSRNLLARVKSS